MQVIKFGGTSVADASAIGKVIAITKDALKRDRTILVCSAISGCTDTLASIGRKAAEKDLSYKNLLADLQARHHSIIKELLRPEYHASTTSAVDALFNSLGGIVQGVYLLGELSDSSLDAIMCHGELLSTKIISAGFSSCAIDNRWIDSRDVVKTREGALDKEATDKNIQDVVGQFSHTNLFIAPGFIATDEKGRMATLGRGGSDYTAAIFAVALNARRVEIWTDVPGMMTSNPKIVPTARTISNISYRAALELSHFGAKVIYPPTIQPVVAEGIPIYVKDTFHPENEGTLIENNPPKGGGDLIGISNSDNIALISLEGSGMVGIPGFSSRLFAALSRNDINIILITQASSVHTMCIAISEKDAPKAKAAADDCFAYEISLGKLNPLKVETGYSIVCLVGNDVIGGHSGATGRMLAALGAHGIPVRATAQGSSERNISVILPSDRVNEAIRQIHYEFFDKSTIQQVNLYIAGYGTIGKALVKIIAENHDAIRERTNKDIHICGLANSRKYVLNTEGIDPFKAGDLLAEGKDASSDAYFEALANLSQENSIFVDCTACPDMEFKYTLLTAKKYSIVACNKIPFSGPYSRFDTLIRAAQVAGVNLRYETTVGAALPIIATITRCNNCGDSIHKVEAVLSGTLSYLFDKYDGGDFGSLVLDAKAKGYTEPDPSTDLSGRDVLRKLLIISRLAGIPLEESDVDLQPVPDEKEVKRLYDEAKAQGKRLKYVATLDENRKAVIGLKAVDQDSPLYGLRGTDNAALITTDDYPSPMVIQGAGAGARQTAGGILNDILL